MIQRALPDQKSFGEPDPVPSEQRPPRTDARLPTNLGAEMGLLGLRVK